jgi:acyl carrier protein
MSVGAALADELLRMVNRDVSLDPTVTIGLDTDLLMTGLVDSLGVVEIVAWLEERLAIEIEPADIVLEHFQTVSLMLAYVERRLG